MSYALRYCLTATALKRRLREHRCEGRFAEYIPWILTHEFSSRGWSIRAWSEKMQRTIHLFSRGEYLFFLRLEFSSSVIEFYEQFRIPIDETKKIAANQNFRYPRDPRTRLEVYLTSDFVIRRSDGTMAVRSVKPREDMERERVRQKLQIERIYWRDVGGISDWATISRETMSAGFDHNIAWVWRVRSESKLPQSIRERREEAKAAVRTLLLHEACTLRETAARLGDVYGSRGDGTVLLRHFLAAGDIPEADFSVKFNLDTELPLLRARKGSDVPDA